MNSIVVAFISFPKSEIAKDVARLLVNRKLVACAKVINNIDSFYIWEDKLQEESEVYLMLKTIKNSIPDIKKVLDENHPYEVYEFLYHEVNSANNQYTEWIYNSIENKKI